MTKIYTQVTNNTMPQDLGELRADKCVWEHTKQGMNKEIESLHNNLMLTRNEVDFFQEEFSQAKKELYAYAETESQLVSKVC